MISHPPPRPVFFGQTAGFHFFFDLRTQLQLSII